MNYESSYLAFNITENPLSAISVFLGSTLLGGVMVLIEVSKKVLAYLEKLFLRHKRFTGKLELNFKDGVLKDINETRRTKYEEGK